MTRMTRDDPAYWDNKPDDHNDVGLFAIGPQEARPPMFREIETGDANKAPENETREFLLAREKRENERRLALMAEAEDIRREARINRAIAGQFTGRNRNRKRKGRKAA